MNIKDSMSEQRDTVLMVDDDPFWADRYLARLKAVFHVVYFDSANGVREYLDAEGGICGVVLDVMMRPPANATEEETNGGFTTGLYLLRKLGPTLKDRRTPILVLTNYDIEIVRGNVSECGYLPGQVQVEAKSSVSPASLVEIVRAFVEAWRNV